VTSLDEALAEARKIETAVVEAFGLDPTQCVQGGVRMEGDGLRVELAEGPPAHFPEKDWTPEQVKAIEGLYDNFPQRYMASMPHLWETRREWNL
jgi:hypothetical protein